MSGHRCPRDDTEAISSGTMHRRPEYLAPASRHIGLVGSPKRFTASDHVDECGDGPGKQDENHEGPLEHGMRWRAPDIDADECNGETGQHEPHQHCAFTHDGASPAVCCRLTC